MIEDIKYEMRLANGDSNMYELIILQDNDMLVNKAGNTKEGHYNTHDVWQRVTDDNHNLLGYKLIGRSDGIIIHCTGNKTSAIPYELDVISNADDIIKHCCLVGVQRNNCALLVELKHNVQVNDDSKQKIWNAVQYANNNAPQYSRVTQPMIYILERNETLAVDSKNHIKRNVISSTFGSKIDELYNKYQTLPDKANDNMLIYSTPIKFDNETMLCNWLAKQITDLFNKIYDHKIILDIHKSLAAQGMDYLIAIQLFNIIIKPNFLIYKNELRVNIVYQHNTIELLAKYLYGLQQGQDRTVTQKITDSIKRVMDAFTYTL